MGKPIAGMDNSQVILAQITGLMMEFRLKLSQI